MQIDNLPPKKPNFGLVVALAGVSLIVFFVLAYLFLHREHLAPGRYTKHPVSDLRVPRRSIGSRGGAADPGGVA